jgi:hypothetical protein
MKKEVNMSNVQLPVQIITRKIALPGLEVFYPSIIAGTNSSALLRMNQQIYNLVNKLIVEQGYYQEPQTTQVNGDYEIKTNERGVLSLSIINYTYHYHAAHGLTIIKPLNFDIHTGNNYQLHELFKPESNYIQILSDVIKRQIKERDIQLIEEFKEIRPDQDYYIADKALVIYFQLYELTPYAYGFPHFPISVYEISDIIKEDSILRIMLTNM